MENERRDEKFTMVLNRWHMPYRRGAQCAPMQRHIKRFAGAHCAPLRLCNMPVIAIFDTM